MRSPFAIFRKNQKTMMVVLVGLAMIGFVLLGAVQDPTNMPKALVFIAALAVVGGAAWIAGMPSGRSKEYGSTGLVLGAIVAIVLTVMGDQPRLAVLADTGDLTIDDLQELRNQREVANRFVSEALRMTRNSEELRDLVPKYSFSFMQPTLDRDIATGELLRREAVRLGLHVPEEAVVDYIRKLTDNKISAQKFEKIRDSLRVSEDALYEMLANELQARMAAEFLYGVNREEPQRNLRPLPPEQFWELYRRMYVRQKLEVAALPVEQFIDETAEPTPEELAELFDKYRSNTPLRTPLPEGRLEEGRPGFMQPRRAQVAYLEAVFDDFTSQTAPVTDEDIERYYQENFVKPAAEAAEAQRNRPPASGPKLPDSLELDLPALPSPPASDNPPSDDDPAGDGPGEDAPAQEEPAADAPAAEPTTESEPAETPTDEPAETSELPADSPAEDSGDGTVEPGAADESTEKAGDEPGLFSVADGDAEPVDGESEAAVETEAPAEEPSQDSPEGDPATTKSEPAESEPTESTAEPPASETPAESEASDTPAETPPEDAKAASGDGTQPPAPQSNVPLLDEALRDQIRSAIQNERTAVLLRRAANKAKEKIDNDVGYNTSVPEDEPDHMTAEQAAEIIKQYAAENNLHYAEAPFLSQEELYKSEEHPVGAAIDVDDPNRRPLASVVFQTGAQDTFRPVVVENTTTQSWFVAWKIAEREPYEPQDFNDERVREQVVATWRELEAREKAKARGESLVAIASASGQPLSASLGETTVTGKDGDLFLTVTETPEFSWLSSPGAPGPNPFAIDPPRIQDPPGVENVYEDFMRIVFDELEPGDVGVAPNLDRSTYYVVRVASRTPTPDAPGYAEFRERFLREPVFEAHPLFAFRGIDYPSMYQQLAMFQTAQGETDWAEELRRKHGMEMVNFQPQQPPS